MPFCGGNTSSKMTMQRNKIAPRGSVNNDILSRSVRASVRASLAAQW